MNDPTVGNNRVAAKGYLPRATCSASGTSYMVGAVLFAFAGCASIQPDPPHEIILAQVNGAPITVEVLEAAFTESHQGHSAFLAGQGAVRQLLEKVIDKQLLLQEAKRVGLDEDPQVDHAVQRLRAARASEKFYRAQITESIAISEQSILEAQKRMGDRFQARHILVDSRDAAERALSRIQAGADFGEIAVEISQAKTAAKGGYLGLIRFGQLEPELEEHLWPLQAGEISEPFETPEGWNLLYVSERKSAPPPALEKVRKQVQGILTKRETKRRQDMLLRALEKRWNPQIDETALRGLVAATDKRALAHDAAIVTLDNEKITIAQILPRIDFEILRKLSDPTALRALRNMLDADILGMLIRKEALAQGYGHKPDIDKEVGLLREKMAVELLFNRVAFAKLDAAEAEAHAYWQSHPQTFTEPAAVKLGVIFINSESEANKVLVDLKAGADFAVMARKLSEHRPSADLGGDLGWVNRGRLQPEIEKVAFSLTPGELGIAQLEAGYMIVRLEANKPERLKPFAEAKQQAKDLTLQEKARATLKAWITKLREASVIEIDESAISRAAAAYEEKVRQKAAQTHS